MCWDACALLVLHAWAREDYTLLHEIGAKRLEAKLDDVFLNPREWRNVSAAGLPSTKRRRCA